MNALELIFESAMAQAIGWALLHLVWQGTVLALITAVLLTMLRNQSSNARYLVACTAMALMILLPVVTGTRVYRQNDAAGWTLVIAPSGVRVAPAAVERVAAAGPGAEVPLAKKLQEQARTALPWFLVIWAAGVTVLLVRLLLTWTRIGRLCREALPAPQRWQSMLARVSSKMELASPIRLIESARVEVPMVVGWLRPVVLVPITAITGLTPEQFETILAHELAHVKRNDFLVNVLQTIVETLLFYHPAVWWLSGRIREERENCCDDDAVTVCGSPILYARALADLEGLRSIQLRPAVAADGGSLRHRVVRLLSSPRRSCSYRWVTGASVITMAVAAAIATPLSLMAYTSASAAAKSATVVQTTRQTAAEAASPAREVIEVVAPAARAESVHDREYEYEAKLEVEHDAEYEYQYEHEYDHEFEYDFEYDLDVDVDLAAELQEALASREAPEALARARVRPVRVTAPAVPAAVARVTSSAIATADAESLRALAHVRAPRMKVAVLAPAPVAAANAAPAPPPRRRSDAAGDRRMDSELTVDQLIELRNHGVTSKYINSLREVGYDNLTFRQLIELRMHRVTAEYVRSMKAAGFGELTTKELVELRMHGVTPEFMSGMHRHGFADLSTKDAVQLRIHGVTPQYIEQMQSAGFGKLTAKQLVKLRNYGITSDYVRELASVGYPSLSLSDVQKFGIHGVTAAYVRELKAAGLTKLSADEIVKLRISGVDAEFIRDVKQYRRRE